MTPPALYYQPEGIAARVLERCDAIKRPFNPTVWAPNGHVQSALGLLRTLSARGSYTRQLVMTSDHGTLGLDWWCGADTAAYAAADAPIILFIHGINGGSHEGYVKWACVAAASRGWRAVVLNMRGCNGLPITSARGYNAINTGDVHVAVQSIRGRFPAAPLMAAGYSLGSVLLAKYLAESDNGYYSSSSSSSSSSSVGSPSVGHQRPPDSSIAAAGGDQLPDLQSGSGLVAAALVSPPVCLHTTNSKMGRPNSVKFLYNLAVAYKLREYVREHMATMHAQGVNIDADAMLSSWTVRSFDDAVTLKALGYPAPDQYYRHACGTNYIPHIRTPTLIMVSRDDPFLGVLPQEQVQSNPFTLLAATRRGGHLAFLQGWWPLGASYCDAVIDDWMQAALQEWRYGPTGQATASSSSSSSSTAQLPSWVDRAQALGWQSQPFDPQSLAHAMCTCNPELDPLAQAQAADALLNASPAAPAAAAIAAGKAAAKRARHSWSFGFGGRLAAAGEAADSRVVNGLRGGGAWAPFEAAGGVSGSSSISKGAVGLLGTSPAAAAAAAEAAVVEASVAAAAAEEEEAGVATTGLLRPPAAAEAWAVPAAAERPLLSKL